MLFSPLISIIKFDSRIMTMEKIIKKLAFLYITLSFTTITIAQQNEKIVIPDSLMNISYKELVKKFYKNRSNLSKARLYSYTYLQKGKLENNENRIAQGYHFMSFFNEKTPLESIYLDSAIYVTKELKNSEYPAMSYVMKGDYYFKKRNFKDALDNYTIGSKYAKESNVEELVYRINFNIGLLKTRLGRFDESIIIFDLCKNYYLNKKDAYNYLRSLFALSDANVRLKKYDEATSINKKGYSSSLKYNDTLMLNYFILEEGANQFYKKNYTISIDSINKSLLYLKKIDDKPNLAMVYYYLGMNYYATGDNEKAVAFFKKVDLIFKIVNDLHPDTRRGYELLINYYKAKRDLKNQLYYIEQLMKLDGILNTNYKYLSRKIVNEYDTPQLIAEKEKMITNLNKNVSASTFKIIALFLLVVFLLVTGLFFYKKQKQNLGDFEKLLSDYKKKLEEKDIQINNINDNKNIKLQKSNIELKESFIIDIEQKIRQFEYDLKFLSKDCNIVDTAKEFGTNHKYLSYIINMKKEMNFSLYINNQRIDYAVKKLEENKLYLTHTIEGIAKEVGFNTAESFSKAFFKRTNMQPSFLINELKNKDLK